jgi:hypothetical protein
MPTVLARKSVAAAEQIAAAAGGPFIGFPRYYGQQAAAAELWHSAMADILSVYPKATMDSPLAGRFTLLRVGGVSGLLPNKALQQTAAAFRLCVSFRTAGRRC